MSDSDKETVDTYRCGDCGHSVDVGLDEKAGDVEERTFGSGRRETTEEVLICPECGSPNWLSEPIRELAGTVEKGAGPL